MHSGRMDKLAYESQIKEAKTMIGQQQMHIQTLESQKLDFIQAMKERDKLIGQMQAELHQLRAEKSHLQESIASLKHYFVNKDNDFQYLNLFEQKFIQSGV